MEGGGGMKKTNIFVRLVKLLLANARALGAVTPSYILLAALYFLNNLIFIGIYKFFVLETQLKIFYNLYLWGDLSRGEKLSENLLVFEFFKLVFETYGFNLLSIFTQPIFLINIILLTIIGIRSFREKK